MCRRKDYKTIGHRTRHLPACSAVPQTVCATACPGITLTNFVMNGTTPLSAPVNLNKEEQSFMSVNILTHSWKRSK
jgi:hypothetical protein